ncbi:MAG TPA: hypothetical protein VKB84_20940 [Candidatus Binataceae bacterium]|jgi:hypothetical protein|nr:hypothetical protein [Candidatus Binataceae bacterium]
MEPITRLAIPSASVRKNSRGVNQLDNLRNRGNTQAVWIQSPAAARFQHHKVIPQIWFRMPWVAKQPEYQQLAENRRMDFCARL